MKILMFGSVSHSGVQTKIDENGNEYIPEGFYTEEELKRIIDVSEDEEKSLGVTKQYVNGKFVDYIPPSVYEEEIKEINEWFKMYDNQVVQFNRCNRLNILYDEKYGSIEELDKKANENAKRLTELRNILKTEYNYDI